MAVENVTYIEEILANNPNAVITAYADDNSGSEGSLATVMVKGFITQDISFGSTATWVESSLLPKEVEEINNRINSVMETLRMGAESFAALEKYAGKVRSFRLTNIAATTLHWGSSNFNDLNINMVALKVRSTNRSDYIFNPIEMVRMLLPLTLGEFKEVGQWKLKPTSVISPMGYAEGAMDSAVGLWTINIGQWFKANRMFLLSSVTCTVSKETTPGGEPIYVNVDLTFKPFRMFSSTEIRRCFVESSALGSTGAFVPPSA